MCFEGDLLIIQFDTILIGYINSINTNHIIKQMILLVLHELLWDQRSIETIGKNKSIKWKELKTIYIN